MGAALRYYQASLTCASLVPTLSSDPKVKTLLLEQGGTYGLKASNIITETPWPIGSIEADVHAVLDGALFLVDCGIRGDFPEDEDEAKNIVGRARQAALRLFDEETVVEAGDEEEGVGEEEDEDLTTESLEDRLRRLKQGKEEDLRDKLKEMKGDTKPAPTQEDISKKLATLGVAVGVGVNGLNSSIKTAGGIDDVDDLINQVTDAVKLEGGITGCGDGEGGGGEDDKPIVGETLEEVMTSLNVNIQSEASEIIAKATLEPPAHPSGEDDLGSFVLISTLMNCVSNMTSTGEDGEQKVVDEELLNIKLKEATDLIAKLTRKG
jgi:hypothetical protein